MKKRNLVVFLAISLLLISLATASMLIPADDNAKENSQAPENSPVINETASGEWELERVDFIHYAKPENPARSFSNTCYKLMGVKWKSLPVTYTINPTNPDNLSESFVTSAIQKSQKQYAIVAGNFKYDKEKSYRGPKCGQGNINTYPCFFFTETTHGEVIEIAEWPNKLLFQKYSDILPLDPDPETSNLFINDSVRFSSNIIYFDTEYANGCATTYKQHWSFNIDTKEFIFNNQEITNNDGC